MKITDFDITEAESGLSVLKRMDALLTIKNADGVKLATGKFDGDGNIQFSPPDFKLPPDIPIKIELNGKLTK